MGGPVSDPILRIGVDLGGTKIAVVGLAADDREVARLQRPTPRQNYDETVREVAAMVNELETATAPASVVGIAMPGSIVPTTGLVQNANSTWLNGQPFQADLENLLGRRVRTANDANCFALSEAYDGAARGAASVFGVILGTGCGGGLVVDGHLVQGHRNIGGEWGHNPLPWATEQELPGPVCYCGKQGCIETFLSGPGLARSYRASLAGNGGGEIDAAEISHRAAAGDPAATATLARYCDRLARGLASVINIIDPDAIVLGGGLSQLDILYQEVPSRLPAYVFSDGCRTPIVRALHGDSSGVRGAAWLWHLNEHEAALVGPEPAGFKR